MSENTRVNALSAAVALATIEANPSTDAVLESTRRIHNFLLRGSMPNPIDVHAVDHPVLKRMLAVCDLVNNQMANQLDDPVMWFDNGGDDEPVDTLPGIDDVDWHIAGRVITDMTDTADSYDLLSLNAARGLWAAGVLELTPATVNGEPVLALRVAPGEPSS